jgi:mercuric ion transport protein
MTEHNGTAPITLAASAPPTLRSSGGKERLMAAGGILGAVAASSCCIVPLILFGLGASGAWIGTLSALSPYQPLFIAVTAGFLVTGFYLIYRKPTVDCADDAACARPLPRRSVKIVLWAATVIVAAAAAFPYAAPVLLGV